MDRAIEFHRSTYPGRNTGQGGPMPQFFKEYKHAPSFELPREIKKRNVSVEKAIMNRRSRRKFKPDPLTIDEISDILYFTYGSTAVVPAYGLGIEKFPLRAAPSAGALAPIELYPVLLSPPEDLKKGIYHYNVLKHSLEFIIEGDVKDLLIEACLGQHFVGEAPFAVIFTAVYSRSKWRYGLRAYRYIHLDCGFAAENLYLIAESLGLGTVAIGAFDDEKISVLLQLSDDELPMLVMPVGRYRD